MSRSGAIEGILVSVACLPGGGIPGGGIPGGGIPGGGGGIPGGI